MRRYFDWIRENVPVNSCSLCTPVCLAMRGAFPELVLMSGEVVTRSGQVYSHTWLQLPDGSGIIDPTESQFGETVTEYHAEELEIENE